MRTMFFAGLLCMSVVAAVRVAVADDAPPAGAKPLSTILQELEEKNVGVIVSVEFDDGMWEVKTCKDGACQKRYLDTASGEEKRVKLQKWDDALPPADGKKLSEIVRAVEARGLGNVEEIEFDDGYWEIELRKDGEEIEIKIDARTGE